MSTFYSEASLTQSHFGQNARHYISLFLISCLCFLVQPCLAHETDDAFGDDEQSYSDPFKQMQVMQSRMNRLFNKSFAQMKKNQRLYDKAMDSDMTVTNNSKNYIVKLKIPKKIGNNYDIQLTKGMLTVSGKKSQYLEKHNGSQKSYYHSQFTRSQSIPNDVDQNTMKNSFDKGMLTISFKKKS